MELVMQLAGLALICLNIRQGAVRKMNPDYHLSLGRSQKTQNLIVTLLGLGNIVGIVLIIFSSSNYLLNIGLALGANFIVAPSVARFTTGSRPNSRTALGCLMFVGIGALAWWLFFK